MTLSATEIAQLFTLYMPAYSCVAERQSNGAIALQFTNRANMEVITLPGFRQSELSSAPIIKRLSKALFEEFAVTTAHRPAVQIA